MELIVTTIMYLIGVATCFTILIETYNKMPNKISKDELIKGAVIVIPIFIVAACWVYFVALRLIDFIILLNT